MKKGLLLATLAFSVLFTTSSFGQTVDGILGATSTGNLEVKLQVLDSVQITALDTIDFGTYGGVDTGARNLGDAFCVYVNGGDQYTITPTSVNTAFQLKGAVFSDLIDYVVKFAGAATGAAAASSTAYNVASATFIGSPLLDCGATNNASIDVSMTEVQIRSASTDLYSDTLILVVSPI